MCKYKYLFILFILPGVLHAQEKSSPVKLVDLSVHFNHTDHVNNSRSALRDKKRGKKPAKINADTTIEEILVSFKVDSPSQISKIHYACGKDKDNTIMLADSGIVIKYNNSLILKTSSGQMPVKAHSVFALFKVKKSELRKLKYLEVWFEDINGLKSIKYSCNYKS